MRATSLFALVLVALPATSRASPAGGGRPEVKVTDKVTPSSRFNWRELAYEKTMRTDTTRVVGGELRELKSTTVTNSRGLFGTKTTELEETTTFPDDVTAKPHGDVSYNRSKTTSWKGVFGSRLVYTNEHQRQNPVTGETENTHSRTETLNGRTITGGVEKTGDRGAFYVGTNVDQAPGQDERFSKEITPSPEQSAPASR